MLFFATGATWAALGTDITLGRLNKFNPRCAIWVPTILYILFTGLLLLIVHIYPNVWIARFLCLLIGATLFTCLLTSLHTSIMWL